MGMCRAPYGSAASGPMACTGPRQWLRQYNARARFDPSAPPSALRVSLARYLARLGYGTRKECERLVASRQVRSASGAILRDADPFAHEDVRLDGAPLDPPPGSVVLLHKPVGYVCSTRDRPPLVYDLASPRWLQRTPVLATVGRLDADTSGLLLLTDDGPLNHQLTSPRWHLPKGYDVTLADPLRGEEAEQFASGTLRLQGDDAPLRPAVLTAQAPRQLRLTIREGRYHQVRRMFAAVGHHVVTLHRATFGPLDLTGVALGHWRVLSPEEVSGLRQAAQEAKGSR